MRLFKMYSCINSLRLLIRILLISFIINNAASAGNFNQDIEITFGDHRAKILNGGQQLTLSLDKYSGSGFRSKNEFLLGRFDINMKLVPGNSAGTVTTFYLSSGDHNPTHDEIDYEFLGNSSGEPYTLHTNVYTQGKGNREQQFYLWFDPTHDFHTYSIVWNHKRIIFLVDETPIRVFNNLESIGIPYPNKQPMRIISSLWNADDWATQGGKVRADWSQAPFVASYSNFSANANCVNGPSCPFKSSTNSFNKNAWKNLGLDDISQNKLRWVQQKFMIYNYCSDTQRFWQGLPLECKYSKLLGN